MGPGKYIPMNWSDGISGLFEYFYLLIGIVNKVDIASGAILTFELIPYVAISTIEYRFQKLKNLGSNIDITTSKAVWDTFCHSRQTTQKGKLLVF